MRTSIVAIVIVLAGAALPASADPRILTVQEQVQPQERAPAADPAPARPPAPAPAPAPVQKQAETQGTVPASVPSRYNFQRVDDGFLRLDNTSGQIAFCSPHAVGWACQAVPEDRAALEKEIARLQAEVAGLQDKVGSLRDKVASLNQEIATLREPPPPPRPPADVAPHADKDGGLKMPSDEDIARARTAITNVWRRLMDMMTEFRNDMMRKGQSDRTTL
jgi:cell division protein FtsB